MRLGEDNRKERIKREKRKRGKYAKNEGNEVGKEDGHNK